MNKWVGLNYIDLNEATLKLAVQEWLDRQFAGGSVADVTTIKQSTSGNGSVCFRVSLSTPEPVPPK